MTSCQLSVIGAVFVAAASAAASDLDEFKVKRAQVFVFTEKPVVRRDGDRVTITFATKALCDVTAAIENTEGKIVRHLASGVLGVNAPPPFQKNSLEQTLVWDGKDDQGDYIDDKDALAVRVSLGLKPRFERTLFWSPKKRLTVRTPLVQATPEGVYVYDGDVVDHVRLFGHQGNYVRTVYPFPASRLGAVRGLRDHTFPQDGKRLPLKEGFFQATLLTSGPNAGGRHADGKPGKAAQAMAVSRGRLALIDLKLNRLASDGATPRRGSGQAGGLALTGPKTSITVRTGRRQLPSEVSPLSAAFDPAAKRLYLTAYFQRRRYSYLANFYCVPAVMSMDYAGDEPPRLFVGSLDFEKRGKDNARLNVPASVAVDAKGRVYVADFMNDRVQVFSPEGKHLKTIRTSKPAQVCIHHKTQEIYVFSWALPNHQTTQLKVQPKLTRFGPFEDPKQRAVFPLPVPFYENPLTSWYGGSHIGIGWGQPVLVTLDSWTDPPTIWMAREKGRAGLGCNPESMGIRRLVIQGDRLKESGRFGKEAARSVVRLTPAEFQRQRLYVNPADGALYVAECRGYCKSVEQLVKIDPGSGQVKLVDVPFSAEDFAFDLDGRIHLRTNKELARYDPATWREVPFDYGEEDQKVGYTASGMGLKTAPVISAVRMPAPATWHQGGMCVSVKGHIAVSCYNKTPAPNRAKGPEVHRVQSYVPKIFPGRARMGEVHIWDKHGQRAREDAVKGLGILNGVGIDANDNIYVLVSRNRILDGKPYFNPMAGTLIKFRAGSGRVMSTRGAPVPLRKEAMPKRPGDVVNGPHGTGWAEGAEWMYGGVGFGGKNPGTGCACWNCRFDLDYFGRSFAPEIDHYSVAVLDSSGNLILRVGQYGNADDGVPLVTKGGPPKPRSIGGDGGSEAAVAVSEGKLRRRSVWNDEVALFHACYVATHTDRRLFIADAGNQRLLSVRLGYHATEKVALKDIVNNTRQGAFN